MYDKSQQWRHVCVLQKKHACDLFPIKIKLSGPSKYLCSNKIYLKESLVLAALGITKLETNLSDRTRSSRLWSYMNELNYRYGTTDHPSIINTRLEMTMA